MPATAIAPRSGETMPQARLRKVDFPGAGGSHNQQALAPPHGEAFDLQTEGIALPPRERDVGEPKDVVVTVCGRRH